MPSPLEVPPLDEPPLDEPAVAAPPAFVPAWLDAPPDAVPPLAAPAVPAVPAVLRPLPVFGSSLAPQATRDIKIGTTVNKSVRTAGSRVEGRGIRNFEIQALRPRREK